MKVKKQSKTKLGFTLVELLVVLGISAILLGISAVALQSSRTAARDGKRKADLEMIRSGLEIFRSDCGIYPTAAEMAFGGRLAGNGSSTSCATTNEYIARIPTDPQDPTYDYYYVPTGTPVGTTYILCARLEIGGGTDCNAQTCGSAPCNYQVINP